MSRHVRVSCLLVSSCYFYATVRDRHSALYTICLQYIAIFACL